VAATLGVFAATADWNGAATSMVASKIEVLIMMSPWVLVDQKLAPLAQVRPEL
jgi:hypothetical protein